MTVDNRRAPHGITTHWVDGSTRAALELIAAGVNELVGFDVAAISVVVDEELEVVAVSGNDSARRALQGSRTPIEITESLLELAEDWGVLRFIPHERAADYLSRHGWTPDVDPLPVKGAWHAEDMLFAPFLGPTGSVQGLLAVDLPRDGLRPGTSVRAQLERYAVQAERAVQVALERARLAEHVKLASRARQAVRRASRELSLDGLLMECQADLVEGFRAIGIWIHTLDDEGEASHGVLHSTSDVVVDDLPDDVVAIAERSARRGWGLGRAGVFSRQRAEGYDLEPAELETVLSFMETIGVASILFVPIGEGRRCLGSIVLSRGVGDLRWTPNDISVALDVGSDVGHAVAHARAFEREQSLVRELQELDTYKSELIATLSHELKTPLASILGNLELLQGTEEVTDDGRRSLAAIERGTQRLTRVVGDLMLLAKIGDPRHPLLSRPVDMAGIVDDVLKMTQATVQQRELRVALHVSHRPVMASGDPDELDRVVANLISNATKYTEVGGRIDVRVDRLGDQVVLTCTDDGIGISEKDQQGLFREFFRSTNPRALGVTGTGLGLSIVERIVSRHGGRIAVRSTLGAGASFEVILPAAADAAGPTAPGSTAAGSL